MGFGEFWCAGSANLGPLSNGPHLLLKPPQMDGLIGWPPFAQGCQLIIGLGGSIQYISRCDSHISYQLSAPLQISAHRSTWKSVLAYILLTLKTTQTVAKIKDGEQWDGELTARKAR